MVFVTGITGVGTGEEAAGGGFDSLLKLKRPFHILFPGVDEHGHPGLVEDPINGYEDIYFSWRYVLLV